MMIMTYILDWPFETSYSDLNGAIFRGEPLFLKRTKQQLNNSQAVIKENVLNNSQAVIKENVLNNS